MIALPRNSSSNAGVHARAAERESQSPAERPYRAAALIPEHFWLILVFSMRHCTANMSSASDWPVAVVSRLTAFVSEALVGMLDESYSEFAAQTICDESIDADERRTTVVDMVLASVEGEPEEQRPLVEAAVDRCMHEWQVTLLPIAQDEVAAVVAAAKAKADAEAAAAAASVLDEESAARAATLALFYQQDDDGAQQAWIDGEEDKNKPNKKGTAGAAAAGLAADKRPHLNAGFEKRAGMYDSFLNELDSSATGPDIRGMGRRAKRNALKGKAPAAGGRGSGRTGGDEGSDADTGEDSDGSSDDGVSGLASSSVHIISSASSSAFVPAAQASAGPKGGAGKKQDARVVVFDPMDIKLDNHEFGAFLQRESAMKNKAEHDKNKLIEVEKAAAARAAKELALNQKLAASGQARGKGVGQQLANARSFK